MATLSPTIAAAQTAGDGVGTVALVSGKASLRKGAINLPTPAEAETKPPAVKYDDEVGKELGPNDQVKPGDIVVTGDDSYLKIYYKDDSIMDVGPNTVFKVEKFNQEADGKREILFSLLAGKVRTLVTRALDGGSSYRVATPTSSMGVHGTEWVTNAYPFNGQYRTDVTVIEGKVMVEMPKLGLDGRAGIEQLPITAGKTFSGIGNGGSVAQYNMFKLNADQIKEITAMIPNIETKRIGTIAINTPAKLPGTGLGTEPPGVNERALAEMQRPERGGGTLSKTPAELARSERSNSNIESAGSAGASAVNFAQQAQPQPQAQPNTAAAALAANATAPSRSFANDKMGITPTTATTTTAALARPSQLQPQVRQPANVRLPSGASSGIAAITNPAPGSVRIPVAPAAAVSASTTASFKPSPPAAVRTVTLPPPAANAGTSSSAATAAEAPKTVTHN